MKPRRQPSSPRKAKRKNSYFWHDIRSSWWFPLAVCFVMMEFAVLMFLVIQLDSHHHLSTTSLRRKIKRLMDPQWRSRDTVRLRKSFLKQQKETPIFDHSRMRASLQDGYRYLYRDSQNNQQTDKMRNKSKTLDDFYSRSHILPSRNKNAQNSQSQPQRVPFLVVGGSDGSGTRTFVQILARLGVTMIVDDYQTMDVHGQEMELRNDNSKQHLFGWPPLVQMVLNATHSADYSVRNLPRPVQEKAMEALIKLKSSLAAKGKHISASINIPGPPRDAIGVQYGFKAPIAMVLLPLLQQVLGPLKFVHVVRDGRDVALSENQSPLERYYRRFYGKLDNFPLLKKDGRNQAMQLWNDWNLQVLQWERRQQKQNSNDDPKLFDYLVLRTEDLVHPDTRLEALVQLAEFVGARMTPEQLCCLSHQPLEDLGQSGLRSAENPRDALTIARYAQNSGAEEEQKVLARYGKWKQLQQDKPEVLAELQKTGQMSLATFGYEPPARFLDDFASEDIRAFGCEAKVREGQIHCDSLQL